MAKIGFKLLEISTDFDPADDSGTWQTIAVSTLKKDGLSLGEPEAFTEEHADDKLRANGYRWTGVLPFVLGTTNIPTDNTAFWLALTPHTGSREVIGGLDGCIGHTLRTPIASLGMPQPQSRIAFQFTASTVAEGIKDVAAV